MDGDDRRVRASSLVVAGARGRSRRIQTQLIAMTLVVGTLPATVAVSAPASAAQVREAPVAASTTTTTIQHSGLSSSGASLFLPQGLRETDQATISGSNASRATGTVAYTLYSSPSCAASSEVFQSTGTVSAGVAAASKPMSLLFAPGKYYWQAIYSGDAGNLSSMSACGSEVLTVFPPVTVAATALLRHHVILINLKPALVPSTLSVTVTKSSGSRSLGGRAPDRHSVHQAERLMLASSTITVRRERGTPQLFKIHLTSFGRQYFRHHRGAIRATVTVAKQTESGRVVTTQAITILRRRHST